MSAANGLVVVKVGGSLYDLPDLGPRLWRWLRALAAPRVLLVPGGGPTAEVIRDLDRRHALGEETAHELALRALTLNAWFLASLLKSAARADDPEARFPVCDPLTSPLGGRFALLDAHAFGVTDEARHPGALPACWDATSDSLAARAAVVLGAGRLVLLKSVDVPEPYDWGEAARRGTVDPIFASMLAGSLRLRVEVVNLRAGPAAGNR
jgi:aspartokinase-like uncharacterized kinase